MKIRHLLCCSALLLTACSGGPSATHQAAPVTPVIQSNAEKALEACRTAQKTRDIVALRKRCKPLAESGNAEAQYIWGSTIIGATYAQELKLRENLPALDGGQWTIKDDKLEAAYKEGHRFINASAAQGNEEAQAFTMFIHYVGAGVEKDLRKSWEGLRALVRAEYPDDFGGLLDSLKKNLDLEKTPNPAQMLHAAERLVGSDHPQRDMVHMGVAFMYFAGLAGFEQNTDKGMKWANIAADEGNVMMQTILATMRLFGIYGVDAHYGEALHWSEQAARQGNHNAMTLLGFMHMFALCTEQDPLKAYTLFAQAAINDPSAAQVLPLALLAMNKEQKHAAEVWKESRRRQIAEGGPTFQIPSPGETPDDPQCYRLKPI